MGPVQGSGQKKGMGWPWPWGLHSPLLHSISNEHFNRGTRVSLFVYIQQVHQKRARGVMHFTLEATGHGQCYCKYVGHLSAAASRRPVDPRHAVPLHFNSRSFFSWCVTNLAPAPAAPAPAVVWHSTPACQMMPCHAVMSSPLHQKCITHRATHRHHWHLPNPTLARATPTT
jgi:hypothetical protein